MVGILTFLFLRAISSMVCVSLSRRWTWRYGQGRMYFDDATDRAYNRHSDLTVFVSDPCWKYLSPEVACPAMVGDKKGAVSWEVQDASRS